MTTSIKDRLAQAGERDAIRSGQPVRYLASAEPESL